MKYLIIIGSIIIFSLTSYLVFFKENKNAHPIHMHQAMTQRFKQDEIKKIFSSFTVHNPHFLKARDGIQLAYYPFLSDPQPKAIVIFYHGARNWSNALCQNMAQETSKLYDISMYLIDIRGHGHSQGPRGDTSSRTQVWDDIDTVIDFVTAQHPNIPILLAGHSAGCGLIINYLAQKKEDNVDGYIFLAPFFGSDSGTTKEEIDPSKQFVKPKKWALIAYALSGGQLFSHTPAIFFNAPEWLGKPDPLILSHYTCAMAMAMFPYNAKEIVSKITKPYALFIGREDERLDATKVMVYQEYFQNKNRLTARIIPDTDHRSILLEAPLLFEEAWKKFSQQEQGTSH